MNSSTKSLKRNRQRFSILLFGSTGHGKSATINHLLNTDTIETGSDEPETKATVEYLVHINNHNNEAPILNLGIIDTPGVCDPRGLKQDARNLHSMKHFFKSHPTYSGLKCYPNLIFLVISANEHRIDGSNSKLAYTLRALNELGVVDNHHPNVVAVLTFCCSVNSSNLTKWEEIMKEKKEIISKNIYETLGVRAPVVLLENDRESIDLKNDDDFTLLPNSERQPENLYKTCQKILKDNGDRYGLSTFQVSLAEQPNTKKQYRVDQHKVFANDSEKNSISKVEQDLLDILRGSTEDGKEIMRNIGSGRRRSESKTKLLKNAVANRNCRWPGIKTTVGALVIVACVIGLFVMIGKFA